jgi:putative ABC transport system ATP-binding protein
MINDSAFIICENLVKIFKVSETEVLALQGLDLSIKQGELVGIVGSSGSGKSTLMNVLGGLVRPSVGQILVGGKSLLKMSSRELDNYRQIEVGFVWQQGSRNLIPYLSALENIKLPMTLAGRVGRSLDERAKSLLDMVGLQDRYHHKPQQLSGGEQQRVAIAVALANDPKLLLADEPTGDLDSATSEQIYALFQRLNHEFGLTIIIVSHDPQIAQHVGRVAVIRDGKMATETVRRGRDLSAAISSASHHEAFEELIVLDSVGRLQIPKEIREQLSLQNRVQMEVTDEGLLIRPVEKLEETSSQAEIRIERQYHRNESNQGILSKLKWWKNQR